MDWVFDPEGRTKIDLRIERSREERPLNEQELAALSQVGGLIATLIQINPSLIKVAVGHLSDTVDRAKIGLVSATTANLLQVQA